MLFSIITPNYNSGQFLEATLESVISQRKDNIELEFIIVDGNSSDDSHTIFARHKEDLDLLLIEADTGPANAINKGLALAKGDVIAWLNADDFYYANTLSRVQDCFEISPESAFCFGGCSIINEQADETRHNITRFKEMFFPVSSRFTHQCINYISQPALFFRRDIIEKAGFLREDMVAAWDYEFILRLWRHGKGALIDGPPLSAFRWHEQSISGQNFELQFKEEYDAVVQDTSYFHLQAMIHFFVRWGIVGIYSLMNRER